MSYLKIFPRSITAHSDDSQRYVGLMLYDFELYGRMSYWHRAEVVIARESLTDLRWVISSVDLRFAPTGFSEFIHTLNHYLFDFLKFDPLSHWYKPFASQHEFHFESVYFDLGLQKFVPTKS
jgi:hypothetical protein